MDAASKILSDVFSRHERVAFTLSGGKDSLVVLNLLRPFADQVTIYWLNPGNPFPATVEQMEGVRNEWPYFKEVPGRQREVIAADGWPSDVVPARFTSFGHYVFGAQPFKVQGRLDCCWRSLMAPMIEAIMDDAMTCLIRGKREDEADKSPTRTGDVVDGIEVVYPIWDWTADDVLSFIEENGIALPESYQYANHSLDCMDCTAWWGDGLSKYLEAKHPPEFAEYLRRVTLIKRAVAAEMQNCEV
jgi:phosphoadenosine phosphosulfate reductase